MWREKFLTALKNRVDLRGWSEFTETNYDVAMQDLLTKDKSLAVKSNDGMFVAGDNDAIAKSWKTHSFSYSKENAMFAECHRQFGKDGEWPIDTFNRMISEAKDAR